jgi:phage gp45-like
MRSSPYLTRFEIASAKMVDGQLLVSGKGMAGEVLEDHLFIQPHGAASNPPVGAVGVMLVMPGRRSQSLMIGVEAPGNRPALPAGASALYDASGNIIKLMAGGVTMDFQSRTVTLTAGTWNLKGNLNVDGNITATGSIIDAGGNSNHHSH